VGWRMTGVAEVSGMLQGGGVVSDVDRMRKELWSSTSVPVLALTLSTSTIFSPSGLVCAWLCYISETTVNATISALGVGGSGGRAWVGGCG